jgi:hypothetical protein
MLTKTRFCSTFMSKYYAIGELTVTVTGPRKVAVAEGTRVGSAANTSGDAC